LAAIFSAPYLKNARMQQQQIEQVIEKLQALPPEKLTEVEDFIDFLRQRDSDRSFTHAAMAATESTLNALWDNADDADYDRL
jgi:hypothetical protein